MKTRKTLVKVKSRHFDHKSQIVRYLLRKSRKKEEGMRKSEGWELTLVAHLKRKVLWSGKNEKRLCSK